jgi:hypothetical protein
MHHQYHQSIHQIDRIDSIKFDQIFHRFDQIDHRFDEFDQIYHQIYRNDHRFDPIEFIKNYHHMIKLLIKLIELIRSNLNKFSSI